MSHKSRKKKPQPNHNLENVIADKPSANNTNDQVQNIVQSLKRKYKQVLELKKELKPMEGSPALLEIKEDVKVVPIHVCTPRKTPYALQGSDKQL